MKRLRHTPGPSGLPSMLMRRRLVLEGGMGAAIAAMLEAMSSMDRAVDASGAEIAAQEQGADAQARAAEQEAVEAAAEPSPDALYRRGDSGEGVLKLQQQLSKSGYWCGDADSGYGQLTQQAVFALQKAHELSRDGVAGPDVRTALSKNYRPRPEAEGSHIEIHLSSQLLLVVRSGSTSMVLNTSTANGEQYEFEGQTYTARTRTGDFAVWLTHASGWKGGELGEMWRPMFYSGNYAIHGSRSIPPWPASHGCSRVSVAAMDMIWRDQVMSMDTRVLVV